MVDKAQFEAWSDELYKRAVHACYHVGLPASEVPDTAGSTLLKLWEIHERLDPDLDRIRGYAWEVARNEARNLMKYGPIAREPAVDPHLMDALLQTLPDGASDALPDPEALASREEERQMVLNLLRFYIKHHVESLGTPKQRSRALRNVFVLARHELRGRSLVQIAEELGISLRKCERAVSDLKKELAGYIDPMTRELQPTVVNSSHFRSITEVSQFLRERLIASQQEAGRKRAGTKPADAGQKTDATGRSRHTQRPDSSHERSPTRND
jgi:RNA polymerase sigma factor (sigma-70 family)